MSQTPSFSLPQSKSCGSFIGNAYKEPKDFYVNILTNDVTILNLNKLKRLQLLQPILELTMMSSKVENTHFFSLTSFDDELSLVTDSELVTKLKVEDKLVEIDDYTTDYKIYNVIQFYEGTSGMTHTGIVQYISKIFSRENIAIIYINSYNNNFILVPTSEFKRAKTLLKKYNYT